MVAVWPVLPQWSQLGGGIGGGCMASVTTVAHLRGGTGGGCFAGVTAMVTLRRRDIRDRWWLCGRFYHSGHT